MRSLRSLCAVLRGSVLCGSVLCSSVLCCGVLCCGVLRVEAREIPVVKVVQLLLLLRGVAASGTGTGGRRSGRVIHLRTGMRQRSLLQKLIKAPTSASSRGRRQH